MKRNYTHLIIVLDESSSMSPLQSATIEGVNGLVKTQKEQPGDFTTAVYKFNSTVGEVKTFAELNKDNYRPGGCTALFDALCTAIVKEGAALAVKQEFERPEKVIVLVVTDGEENSSREFKIADVKEKVSHQQDKYKWEFVFLGANIDAFATSSSYGISMNNTYQFAPTEKGVFDSYGLVSATMCNYRSGGSSSMDLQETLKNQTADAH